MKKIFLNIITSSTIITASNSFAGGNDALLGFSSPLVDGSELKTLGLLIAISVPIGLLFGILLRKRAPNWCRAYSKYCTQKTWMYPVGALYFGFLSITSYAGDRPYFGTFFAAAAISQALVWVLTLHSKRTEKQ